MASIVDGGMPAEMARPPLLENLFSQPPAEDALILQKYLDARPVVCTKMPYLETDGFIDFSPPDGVC
ncbi:MAG: hypothetical protein LBF26_03745 [Puniceicoccales bacterium]|nr:hypothetical protein [Puniceicoccales bacterium]